jgi:hypothetical protein
MTYCIHRWPEVKRASGGWLPGLANIKHLFGRVTLLFHSFVTLWDEQRRCNELTRRGVEPRYEDIFSVIMKRQVRT